VTGRSSGRWLIWSLLGLALLMRLTWASLASTQLWFDHIFTDATAMGLLEGRGFTVSLTPPYDPAIFRTPGYSFFLAGIYGVFGHSVRAAFFANAFIDTASCYLLYRLARQFLSPRVALFALFVAATYPFTIYAVGSLSPETLLVFLGLLFTTVVTEWSWTEGAKRPLGMALWPAGIIVGVLAWIKPVFLPLPLFLFAFELIRGRSLKSALGRAVTVGTVAAVIFLPWVVRNFREFGRPVLAGEMGLVVWHGTLDFEPERDEMVKERFAAAPKKSLDRYEATREVFADSRLLLRRDRVFLDRGLARIRERPVKAALWDPLRRIPRLWISTTFVTGPAVIGWGAAVACVGYLVLAFAGAWSLRGRLRDLAPLFILPALLTAVYAVFHVEARYTLPARPTLLLLAGVALAVLGGWALKRAGYLRE